MVCRQISHSSKECNLWCEIVVKGQPNKIICASFFIIIDKIYVKITCELGAFIFIMDCIKHVFEMVVSKSRCIC